MMRFSQVCRFIILCVFAFFLGKISAVSKRRDLILTLVLAIGTLVLFGRVRSYEFINYDDPYYVTENSHVKDGLTKEGVRWAFGRLHGEFTYWHPVTWLSHMLDCELFGLNAGAHHLVNVLFHALNATLLFWLLKGTTGAGWRSWLVAALFAWHPLQVDSVAWVTERKNLLSTTFWMLTLWAYVRYARGRINGLNELNKRKWIWYGLALAFFALGLMSKPMLVTVPCVMLLLDFWPLNRFHASSNGSRLTVQASRLLLEKLPFFALSAVSAFTVMQAHALMGLRGLAEKLPLDARVAHAIVSYATYLRKVVWPSDLAVFYPHPGNWPASAIALSAVVLLAVTALVLWHWRRVPALVVGWFWFLGVLVPTIGLVSVGSQAMADRFAYVPLIGLFIMAVWGVTEAMSSRLVLRIAVVAVLAACVAVASVQLQHWRNTRTLFEHTARVTRENYIAYAILGSLLAREGKVDQAVEYYLTSLQFHPGYPQTHFLLGDAYSTQKKYEVAVQAYRRAIELQPSHWQAHLNLARILHALDRVDEAIPSYREALRLRPESPEANYFLGKALASKDRNEEALQLYEAAARLKPTWAAAAEKAVANALAQLGRNEEAIARCQDIIRKGPPDAEVHLLLAQLLQTMGKPAEAVAQYREALRINAEVPGTLNNLAWLLATHPKQEIRNGIEAVQLAEKACRLTEYKVPFLLGTLAAAYAEAGRFENAVEMAKNAAMAARQQGQPEVAATNDKLLAEYYAKNRAYRDEPNQTRSHGR